MKGSIWSYSILGDTTTYQFGTFRYGEQSQLVLAYNLTVATSGAWTSPSSNVTYPQAWKLEFEGGDTLEVKSVLQDQEIHHAGKPGAPVFEGFVTVSGHLLGKPMDGYGAVEINAGGA
ncbi:Fc.00g103830.m01.CDS01 [Cosmosporella sp. VM-42]